MNSRKCLSIRRLLWCFILLTATPGFAANPAAEPKPIFDGKTFDGWVERGEAIWEIHDGVITGRTGKGGHGWLCTERTYGDFLLELEVNIESGNSGIQIRSHIDAKDTMVGYQIEVDPTPRAWSGGLYEQGRRAWLQNLVGNEPARAAFKTNEWNHYRILCVGDSIRSWVNGVPVADYVDSMDIEGVIALQTHSGKNARVNFRNIRVADLGRRQWKPLWNGKALEGWHPIGKGSWSVDNGVIAGRHGADEKEFGHLISDKQFKDFTARLKFKTVTGNSGFYFRVDKAGASGVSGFQAEIDPQKDTGGLYETHGRKWVAQPEPEAVKKWLKPGEWNTMTVSAHGGRIVVNVNGHKTAELRDDPGRAVGHLALQLHGGQDVEVYFKDIEILGEPERAHDAVTVRKMGDTVRVDIGGRLFTEYHYVDVPRPFLFPVLGPGGKEMTRRFPMAEKAGEERDHPHHRSLWFGHGPVNGVDFWAEHKSHGRIVHDKFLEIDSGKAGVIKARNRWVAPDGRLICTDGRVIRVHGGDSPRILDFEITLQAHDTPVTFGDSKEGTMAIRIAETMRLKPNAHHPKDMPPGSVVMSTGVRDAEAWGKRAAWVDYHGLADGKLMGIAIFDHPQNPRHPTWWHARDYGLFAANPFGAHDFEKQPKGAGDFTIPAGKSATFKYRFIFHEGNERVAGIADLYKKYGAGE